MHASVLLFRALETALAVSSVILFRLIKRSAAVGKGRKAVRLLRARSNAVCQLAIASLSLSLCYRSYSSHDLISSQPVTIIGHVLDFSSSGQATRTGGGRWRNFWCSVGQIIIWATGLCSCASPACRLQVRSIVLYIDWIGRD
jgi:hypothetical protein